MDDQRRAFEIETLLAESEWVGGLALGLVGDLHQAEDLAQEVWLAALRRGPVADDPARDSARPWLATVARNAARLLGRSEGSRRDREAVRAAEDAERHAGSPADLLARLESQELVSRLVRELPAELSDVVLLAFFEGLTSEQIARLRGIPAATVRSRKKRALELLRERLDGHHDGDRSAWLSALAPLAVTWSRRGAKSAATGGALAATLTPTIAMTLTWKTTASTAAIALVLFALTQLGGGGPELPPGAAPGSAGAGGDPVALADEPTPVAPGAGDPGPKRQQVAPAATPAEPQPAAAAWTRVTLTVVDQRGAPIEGAVVRLSPSLELQAAHEAKLGDLASLAALLSQREQTSDQAGRVSFETDLLELAGLVDFDVAGPRFGAASLSATIEPGVAVDLGAVTVTAAGAVTARLAMADGSDPGKHLVELAPAELPSTPAGLARLAEEGPDGALMTRRAEGSAPIEFLGVAPGEYRLYRSPIAFGECTWSEPFHVVAGQRTEGVQLVLEPDSAVQPSLLVLDPEGQPLATARVELSRDGLRFDESVRRDGTYGFGRTYPRFAGGRLVVTDKSQRYRTTVIEPLPKAPGQLVVRMQAAATHLRALKILGPGGEPLPAAFVRIAGPHGTSDLEGYDGDEPLLLPAASEGSFELTVRAAGHRELKLAGLVADSLPDDWSVTLEALPGIRGRVRFEGEPVERAKVVLAYATRPGRVLTQGNLVSRIASEVGEVRTDGDGRFHLDQEYDGDLLLVVTGRSGRMAWLELADFRAGDGHAELELDLAAPGEVRGLVRDHLGNPVPRAAVVLNHPALGMLQKTADSGGSFQFRRVPAGDWFLRGVAQLDEGYLGFETETPKGWQYPSNCSVSPGAEVVHDLLLGDPAGSRIAGTITARGSDPGRLKLELSGAGSMFAGDPFVEAWSHELELPDDGRFDVPVAEGRGLDLILRTDEPSLALVSAVAPEDLPANLDSELGFARLDVQVADWLAVGQGREWLGIDWSLGEWRTYQRLMPAADGSLAETLVPAGTLELAWRIAGSDEFQTLELELEPGETRKLEL
ncbi:MAG: sigma-70 family RNA polymerase sigma factor [Planctomycetota bacterium]|nr:sigma-70 family RNA polymerase sigma factor [Planctomycetota bacterium]